MPGNLSSKVEVYLCNHGVNTAIVRKYLITTV
ncbi:MAG: hypothetical protein Dbin4_03055 [Alphaproteobacteria bacterium]|nr:hypothetical protein [Alphaproteobacteria bacterium]